MSDHLPILSSFEVNRQKHFRPKYIYVQENSSKAIHDFISDVDIKIRSTSFESNLSIDPHINYESFEKILSSSKEKHLPLKRKRFNYYSHKLSPWMNSEILKMIKFKDQLYKNLKLQSPDSSEYQSLKINLKNYSRLLEKSIRLAKKKYYHSQFEKYKFDSRKTWATINDILSRKKSKKRIS